MATMILPVLVEPYQLGIGTTATISPHAVLRIATLKDRDYRVVDYRDENEVLRQVLTPLSVMDIARLMVEADIAPTPLPRAPSIPSFDKPVAPTTDDIATKIADIKRRNRDK